MKEKKVIMPDCSLLWNRKDLEEWYTRMSMRIPEEPKIRRQKPKPPRDERNVKK